MTHSLEQVRSALSDRYEVEREVDRGGMATIYLARDLKHARPVAIKVLDPDLRDPVASERFLREIDTAARLVHPHILPVHDSGQVQGMLYYVMPFVPGESLRRMLARRGALPLEEAVRIAIEIADAIGYAHAKGIVHRDIKPGNILLAEDGRSWITDFGVARALEQAGAAQVTATGFVIGTPVYMSPEQASGARAIDERSDVYSLGCVLYEMLAGRAPFAGTVAAIIARKQAAVAPSLPDSVRDRIPPAVRTVVERAIAPEPAHRFSTASGLARALAEASGVGALIPTRSNRVVWWLRSLRSRPLAMAGAVAVTALAIAAGWLAVRLMTADAAASLDARRIAVFAFRRARVAAADGSEDLLRQALASWNGVQVVEPARLTTEAPPGDAAQVTAAEARRIARRLGAGRFVLGEIGAGDSPTSGIRAVVYDTGGPDSAIVRVAIGTGDGAAQAQVHGRLAAHILFPGFGGGPAYTGDDDPGTRSIEAHRAYLLAHAALERWDLPVADSLLRAAVVHDPSYARSHFWIAQMGLWTNRAPTADADHARLALAVPEALDEHDRAIADAILRRADGDFASACAIMDELAAEHPLDFAAWYGLAQCLLRDDAVVPSRVSPSRWAFRSSYERAFRAYRRALQLDPGIRTALRPGGYQQVRRLLGTSGRIRIGFSAEPERRMFGADIAWQGDTIAFVPYPMEEVAEVRPGTVASTASRAIDHQREVFHEIVEAWHTATPSSPDVLEALAVSLELRGESSAIDTLRRARALAASDGERYELGAAEVWLHVKFGLPDDTAALARARSLADSLLQSVPAGGRDASTDASLAALLGRSHDVARFARRATSLRAPVPPVVLADAEALQAYAAMGGPVDSIRVLEERVERTVRQTVTPATLDSIRYSLLGRAAALALPVHTFALVRDSVSRGDYLLGLEFARRRGDTTAVRRDLERLRASRRSIRPGNVTIDAVFAEAWIVSALGDTQAAIGWLQPILDAVRWTPPREFHEPVTAASLMRAIRLRADLAAQAGDSASERRWQRALEALWN